MYERFVKVFKPGFAHHIDWNWVKCYLTCQSVFWFVDMWSMPNFVWIWILARFHAGRAHDRKLFSDFKTRSVLPEIFLYRLAKVERQIFSSFRLIGTLLSIRTGKFLHANHICTCLPKTFNSESCIFYRIFTTSVLKYHHCSTFGVLRHIEFSPIYHVVFELRMACVFFMSWEYLVLNFCHFLLNQHTQHILNFCHFLLNQHTQHILNFCHFLLNQHTLF